MNGIEVYNVLIEKGVYSLHHANTVITSCTFLKLRGLASRGYVEDHRMPQTQQYTDNLDKKFGIWYDIFLDGVDVHERGKMRNNYGPVLFILPTNILLNLPPGTEVLVTRDNPVRWKNGETYEERYFVSQDELRNHYIYGDFGKHIILRTNAGILPFNGTQIDILLENPQCKLAKGNDAYTSAVQRLQACANESGLNLNIRMRTCIAGCKCLTGYWNSYDKTDVSTCF